MNIRFVTGSQRKVSLKVKKMCCPLWNVGVQLSKIIHYYQNMFLILPGIPFKR